MAKATGYLALLALPVVLIGMGLYHAGNFIIGCFMWLMNYGREEIQ